MVKAEWEKLREVAVHKPGIEVIFALLDPKSFLFERSFNLSKARKEHDILREVLEKEGVKVRRLRKEIVEKMRVNATFREKIKKMTEVDSEDPNFLFNLLLLKPIVKDGNVIISNPVPNLYFIRDQQITVNNHVIIGKMATKQRERETEITKLFWEAIGMKFNEIKEGKLEGGDFFPMGDFFIVGIGNRSDLTGVSSLFNLGEVAVVHEPRKEFFHLDMYFNVPSSNTVVGVRKIMEESKVEVFHYGKLIKTTNLFDYVREKGFNVIEVEESEARKHLTNFLTIDDGKIVSPVYNEKLKDFDVITVNVENLTGGAGGIHCMTAVVRRG